MGAVTSVRSLRQMFRINKHMSDQDPAKDAKNVAECMACHVGGKTESHNSTLAKIMTLSDTFLHVCTPSCGSQKLQAVWVISQASHPKWQKAFCIAHETTQGLLWS